MVINGQPQGARARHRGDLGRGAAGAKAGGAKVGGVKHKQQGAVGSRAGATGSSRQRVQSPQWEGGVASEEERGESLCAVWLLSVRDGRGAVKCGRCSSRSCGASHCALCHASPKVTVLGIDPDV